MANGHRFFLTGNILLVFSAFGHRDLAKQVMLKECLSNNMNTLPNTAFLTAWPWWKSPSCECGPLPPPNLWYIIRNRAFCNVETILQIRIIWACNQALFLLINRASLMKSMPQRFVTFYICGCTILFLPVRQASELMASILFKITYWWSPPWGYHC